MIVYVHPDDGLIGLAKSGLTTPRGTVVMLAARHENLWPMIESLAEIRPNPDGVPAPHVPGVTTAASDLEAFETILKFGSSCAEALRKQRFAEWTSSDLALAHSTQSTAKGAPR